MSSGLVTIKIAAEILGVSSQTLRHWDRQGRLKPKRARNGYRFYNISNLTKFAKRAKLDRRETRAKLLP